MYSKFECYQSEIFLKNEKNNDVTSNKIINETPGLSTLLRVQRQKNMSPERPFTSVTPATPSRPASPSSRSTSPPSRPATPSSRPATPSSRSTTPASSSTEADITTGQKG